MHDKGPTDDGQVSYKINEMISDSDGVRAISEDKVTEIADMPVNVIRTAMVLAIWIVVAAGGTASVSDGIIVHMDGLFMISVLFPFLRVVNARDTDSSVTIFSLGHRNEAIDFSILVTILVQDGIRLLHIAA